MGTDKIKEDNDNTIGRNIRRLRKDRGMGQTELVRELQLLNISMTRETLVKIERGIQHIQLVQLKGIKQILKVTYEECEKDSFVPECVDIQIMKNGDKYWNATADFALNCSWRAGGYLAELMKEDRFEDNERVLVAMVDGNIAGFCTYANKDELPEKYDFTPFIGFMFVDEKYRGKRLSEKLIRAACNHAAKEGVSKMYIMSGEIGLYEKYGFEFLGMYETIYGTEDQLFVKEIRVGD